MVKKESGGLFGSINWEDQKQEEIEYEKEREKEKEKKKENEGYSCWNWEVVKL